MRYLAVVQYDGTDFVGWQIQPNGRSVEEEIEKVLSQILNTPTKIYGSGRTDAKVHAIGQTFHFDSKEIKDLGKFTYSVNKMLPEDIHILYINPVDDKFNARFSVKDKTYLYIINTGKFDVFNRRFVNQYLQELDIKAIKEASKLFIGKHNFQNFTSKEEDEDSFIRTINSFDVVVNGDAISFYINGDGFMRYMVRMIVGTLIEVGLGKLSIDKVEYYLETPKRNPVPYKAAPEGLYLLKVNYDYDIHQSFMDLRGCMAEYDDGKDYKEMIIDGIIEKHSK